MVTLGELAREVGGALTASAARGADGADDAPLAGLAADSKSVEAGALFAAVPGSQVHGARFASQAIARGAAAVITDAEGERLLGEAGLATQVPVLVVDRVGERLGEIAAAFYGEPAKRLRSFGITGTNGKTTTSYMLERLLTEAGQLTALIGGVELRVGGVHTPTDITTPLPVDLQRMLAAHVAAGGTDAVLEVTSHALLQHRTDPIRFAVAGFTHLSIDHLDYHPTVEHYFEAKSRLFVPERCDAAVVLVDDEWGRTLYGIAKDRLDRVYALTVEGELPAGAEGWIATRSDADGGFALVGTDGTRSEHRSGLLGLYNIANAALAVTMALVGGVPAARIPVLIAPEVPGRMEVVSATSPRVIVDFAHNADALAKALLALRPTTKGRLIVVTGTAGDRDATKRFAMGEACAVNADVVVITDDDPHTEDPAQIRAALIEGTVGHDAEVLEIGDRSEAVHAAVRLAEAADTVVIAGRGHWTVQFVGHDLIELDDREVARDALAAKAAAANER